MPNHYEPVQAAGDHHNSLPPAVPYVRAAVGPDLHQPGPRAVWLALRSLEELMKRYSFSAEQWQRLRDLAFPELRS